MRYFSCKQNFFLSQWKGRSPLYFILRLYSHSSDSLLRSDNSHLFSPFIRTADPCWISPTAPIHTPRSSRTVTNWKSLHHLVDQGRNPGVATGPGLLEVASLSSEDQQGHKADCQSQLHDENLLPQCRSLD